MAKEYWIDSTYKNDEKRFLFIFHAFSWKVYLDLPFF